MPLSSCLPCVGAKFLTFPCAGTHMVPSAIFYCLFMEKVEFYWLFLFSRTPHTHMPLDCSLPWASEQILWLCKCPVPLLWGGTGNWTHDLALEAYVPLSYIPVLSCYFDLLHFPARSLPCILPLNLAQKHDLHLFCFCQYPTFQLCYISKGQASICSGSVFPHTYHVFILRWEL